MDLSSYESPTGTHCSTVSIVDFEHVNGSWEGCSFPRMQEYILCACVCLYIIEKIHCIEFDFVTISDRKNLLPGENLSFYLPFNFRFI